MQVAAEYRAIAVDAAAALAERRRREADVDGERWRQRALAWQATAQVRRALLITSTIFPASP